MTLARRTPMRRTGGPARSRKRPSSPPAARDWTDARAKVDRERRCRVCGAERHEVVALQAAHTIGREHDRPRVTATYSEVDGPLPLWVNPLDVVPLCLQEEGGCHAQYDARRLDLLPHLTLAEQARAVLHVGLVAAYRRLTSTRSTPTREEPTR